MKIFTLFFCLIASQFLQAQIVREPLSIKYAGLGAYSQTFSDVFSATSNSASLAQLQTPSFGVYGERRFMLNELNGFTAIVAVPTSSGTIGVEGDYFGSADFNENQLGILYSRKITKQIDAGVKFNYHTVRVKGYGNASAVNFELGTILHLTEKLHTGIHVYNPTGSKIGKSGNEKLASIYRFGLGYEVSKSVFASTEIVKQEDKDIGINAGLQYNLLDNVFLRVGTATLSNNSYIGVGIKLNYARIDINTAYHPQLGFTPGLLLILNLKKATKE